MLDARRLTVLRAVGRAGSMAGAAAELSFTPSAVSQQVAALERQAGTALVVRQPRGVRLTEAGELLVGHADAVVERLERAEAELADLVGLRAGRLRMASFASAGARLLPDAIGAFRRVHPDVRMSLEIVREALHCPAMIRDGALDLAVVLEFRPGHGLPDLDVDGLRIEHLLDDDLFVALPADHPLATADPDSVDVGALAGERWIRDDGPLCGQQLVRMCAAAGFEPRVAFDSDDYAAVGRLVAAGVGVALVPALAAEEMVPGVALRRTRPGVVRRISALVPAVASPAAGAMLAALVRASAGVASALGVSAPETSATGTSAPAVSAPGLSAPGLSAPAVSARGGEIGGPH